MSNQNPVTLRVETWNVKGKRVGKIVARRADGTLDGATNHRQVSRVGQVATHRRNRA